MSTTDTRAAFKAWAEREGYDTAHTHDGIKWLWLNPMTADLSKAYQAATEAAKATGTAGEPDGWKTVPRKMTDEQAKETVYNINRKYKVAGPLSDFLVRQIWEFGIYASPNPPAEAARQPAPDRQVIEGEFAIQVEKMLCKALGREWSATGISIESLIAALAATAAPVLSDEQIKEAAMQAWPNLPENWWERKGEVWNGAKVFALAILAATNRSQP